MIVRTLVGVVLVACVVRADRTGRDLDHVQLTNLDYLEEGQAGTTLNIRPIRAVRSTVFPEEQLQVLQYLTFGTTAFLVIGLIYLATCHS